MNYEQPKAVVELALFVLRETEKAFQVSETGNEKNAVWLPKSQIENLDDVFIGQTANIVIPEWLALDKELI